MVSSQVAPQLFMEDGSATNKMRKMRLKKGCVKVSYIIDDLVGIISDRGQTEQSIKAARLAERESID